MGILNKIKRLFKRKKQPLTLVVDADGELYWIWDKGVKAKLSDHFTTTEFECTCNSKNCQLQQVNIKLIEKLEDARDDVGGPIFINSGFRCGQKQRQLKALGVKTAKKISTHELGDAADVRTTQCSILKRILIKYFKAIGDATTWFHVDLREDKVRRWKY
jgi:uncharacterized protein YcbK (DUF882 family)